MLGCPCWRLKIHWTIIIITTATTTNNNKQHTLFNWGMYIVQHAMNFLNVNYIDRIHIACCNVTQTYKWFETTSSVVFLSSFFPLPNFFLFFFYPSSFFLHRLTLTRSNIYDLIWKDCRQCKYTLWWQSKTATNSNKPKLWHFYEKGTKKKRKISRREKKRRRN